MRLDWPVKKALKKAIVDWSIKIKGNSKRGDLLSPLGGQNKDLGAASIRRRYLPNLNYVYDAGASVSCISGENKRRQISEYEKSLSSLFILSRVFKEYSSSFGKFCVIISSCKDIYGRHCIQKSATITSTHNLPFLLSRINKLDRDFLYWQTLSLVCPLRKSRDFALSHQPLSAFKDGEYRE